MSNAIPLSDCRVNLFANAYRTVPVATITLAEAIEAIRGGMYQRAVCNVRQVLSTKGQRTYNKAKNKLPALTFAGTFSPARAISHFQQHSGIIHGDLDHLPDVKSAKRAICSDPRTVYGFDSTSGTGLKIGVNGPRVADDPEYKRAWQAVSMEFERLYGGKWDQSGKDISRLCYVSWDPEAYWNPNATGLECHRRRSKNSSPTSPHPSTTTHLTGRIDDYAVRAIRTAVEMIQAAVLGTRHHTRLKASRLLGGFVAGGLLSYDQAYTVLEHALNGYTDDMAAALRTVKDGLKYGQAHPITLEDLVTDREEWIRQYRNTHSHQQWTPPDDPWEGTNALLLKPYVGYRGLWSRTREKGATHGHSR